MSKLNNITEALEQINRLKKEVANLILSLPDNNNIHRVSNKCFIISTNKLDGNIICPHYYDFKYQYEMISEYTESSTPEHVISNLSNIISTGILRTKSIRYKLNPTVIENLKTIVGA